MKKTLNKVGLRQGTAGEILISREDVPDGVWAEISPMLLGYGGYPSSEGLVLTVLQLRLAANEFGDVLLRHNIRAGYDDNVRHLLSSHLSEFRARRDAANDLSSLPQLVVEDQVRSTKRFQRKLTASQLRDLGRLLRLLHGANFSVPGAGKTTTLLATYEACRGRGIVDRLLVIAPKNAFLSWEDEVGLCYGKPDPKVIRIAGGLAQAATAIGTDPEIALITYQFLPNVLPLIRSWASNHK